MASVEDFASAGGQARRERRGRRLAPAAAAGGIRKAGRGEGGRGEAAEEEDFGLQRPEGSQGVVEVVGSVDLHLKLQSVPNDLNSIQN